jgi:hypothetical protein
MRIPKLSAAAAVLALALAAPVAGASADTTPAAPPPAAAGPLLTFVPPKVGPITVSIAPTFIQGKMISPGLNVASPGVSLPPITWTPQF